MSIIIFFFRVLRERLAYSIFGFIIMLVANCRVERDIQVKEIYLTITKIDTVSRAGSHDFIQITLVDEDKNRFTLFKSAGIQFKVGQKYNYLVTR